MFNWFIRGVAAFLSFFIFLPHTEIESYKPTDSESIQTSFTVFADTHLESFTKERFRLLGEALKDVNSCEFKSDAIIFAGDNTMNGQVFENILFYGLLKKYNKIDNVLMACGNHDICPGEHNTGEYDDLKKRFIKYNNAFLENQIDEMYYSKVINGYHYIVLSSDKDDGIQQYLSPNQIEWFKNELKEAEISGKPVFIIDHWPVDDVYPDVWLEGHIGEQSKEIEEIMANSSNRIFYFTGHLHMGLFENDYHVEDRGQITYINIPGLGVENNVGKADYQDSGMGLQVYVYKNKLNLRVRNFSEHKWTDFEYNFTLSY